MEWGLCKVTKINVGNGSVSRCYAREECSVGAEVTPQSVSQVNTRS